MEECKQHMILLLNVEYDAEAEQERGKLCPCTSKTERGILLQLIFKKRRYWKNGYYRLALIC
jgi:hypothetical protein